MQRSSSLSALASAALALTVGCGAPAPTTDPAPVEMTAVQLRAALVERSPLPERVVLTGADELDLTGVALDDSEMEHLMGVDISAMRTLRLGPSRISAADLERLCSMPGLAAVEVLIVDCGSDMGDTAEQFGSAGARQLAACSALRGLRELRLPMCLVDDAGLVAIAAAEWSALKVLDLHGNEIGAAGVGELAKSPMIQRLEQLDLTGNPIGDEGMAVGSERGVGTRDGQGGSSRLHRRCC